MMLKNCLLTALLLQFTTAAFAQNELDALRFSQRNYQITARSLGMANAYSAVGGDYSAASLNPAGLGFYNSSELFISPAIRSISANSTYLGNTESDRRANINIGSIAYVANTNFGRESNRDWKSYTLAIGLSRSMNFHEKIFYRGTNIDHSITYAFAEQARGTNVNNLSENTIPGMAYFAYLIDPAGGETYTPVIKDSMDLELDQEQSIRKKGAVNDINISLAGNYQDKLYIGGTLAFPILSYNQTSTFKEFNYSPGSPNYRSMSWENSFSTSGIGVMMALGAIYRVTDEYRVGLSMQSPTFYRLRDNYEFAMNYNVTSTGGAGGVGRVESDPGRFNYNLTTPFRFTLGNVYQIEKSGIVTFDYEFVNYSSASLDASNYDFQYENNRIRRDYRGTHSLRFGGEYRYENYYSRAGLAHTTSPFKSGLLPSGANSSQTSFSLGAGLRESAYFIDATAHFGFRDGNHLPYDLQDPNLEPYMASHNITEFTFLFSIGTRW